MRKRLLALGLVCSTGLGAIPVTEAVAATPASPSDTTRTNPPITNPAYSGTSRATNTGGSTTTYRPISSASQPSTGAAVSGAAIVQTAMQYIGFPYSATGNSPSTGFSCIGFASFVYRQNGINLPGDLGSAMAFAPPVSFSNLMPGDLLYFGNTVWAGLSHVAIYIGGGRFVHAEWYGAGVRVTSFNNDPKDGNYWIGHYIGANRPWSGAALSPVLGVTTPGGGASGAATGVVPTTRVVKTVTSGPTGMVNAKAPTLNVRSHPNMKSRVQQVIPQGTTVVIVGEKAGWYKVQLPDGTQGWVMATYITTGAGTPAVSASTSTTVVGNPAAPTRQGYPSPTGLNVKTGTLYVHSLPSRNSYVVGTAAHGQQLQIIARQGGWILVRLPDGSTGWIRAAANRSKPRQPAIPVTGASSLVGGSSVTVPTNVRSGPSMNSGVAATLPSGGQYQVIGWSNGWAHVRLANGATGWIRGDLIGGAASPTAPTAGPTYNQNSYNHSNTRSKRTARPSSRTPSRTGSTGRGSVVTAGVRVHSAPGVNAPVVGGAAAGTHVQVLGQSHGWTLVRLPNGQTGYVSSAYVR